MNLSASFPALLLCVVAGCAQVPAHSPGAGHLSTADIPLHAAAETAGQAPLEAPVASAPPPTYSVSVDRIAVIELLTALARDARLDLDIHPGVAGTVTLNAYEQPLPTLLTRIARQADIRIEFDGRHLSVMPDTPVLRSYRIDYVNLSRHMSGAIATSTQIATTSSAIDGQRAGTGNTSLTQIETQSENRFWESLEGNVRAILKEHERVIARRRCELLRHAEGGAVADQRRCEESEEAEFVMVNRETGVLMVRATGQQHQAVAEFLALVQAAARRQVMIEATIVEVALDDGYRQGIDWTRLGSPGGSVRPRSGGSDVGALVPTLTYLSDRLDIKLDLLESFGTVKVLSSPRLSVLNNQTATLKVVEEVVYFLVDASTTAYGDSDREKTTATTTPQSVSVGMVMTLTPQISEHGEITLNIRPTISSISGFRDDPNPSLGTIPNRVPQIRTREIESILRLANGEIAVLGGLMEDKLDYDTGRIPLLGSIPVLGELFTRRENAIRRTELVIFLRPLLVENPAIRGDFAGYLAQLPAPDMLRSGPVPGTRNRPGTLLIERMPVSP